MASFSRPTARKAALGIAAAAALTTGAHAADFTQAECKGIALTATEIVTTIGAKTLSREFRQSFVNWVGADMRCRGLKDIIVVTHEDDAAYATMREKLLSGSKPISLEKAGLRVVLRPAKAVSDASPVQQRSDAAPAPVPAVN